MKPETLFQLSFHNRANIVIKEGIFVRSIKSDDYYRALYLMDFYYYELTWNSDQSKLLCVSYIDDIDIEWIFPGKDEYDCRN